MALIENDSILMSIKKLLNVEHNDMAFDTDIGMAINAEFMTLQQLGIGPQEGFSILEADTRWSDFSDDKTLIEAVKQYVYLKVRMIFDPPASSVVADAFNNRISELEFRLNVQAEKAWETYGKKKYHHDDPDDPDDKPVPSYEVYGEEMILKPSHEHLSHDPFADPVGGHTQADEDGFAHAVNQVIGNQNENSNNSGSNQDSSDSPLYNVQGENLVLFGNIF